MQDEGRGHSDYFLSVSCEKNEHKEISAGPLKRGLRNAGTSFLSVFVCGKDGTKKSWPCAHG
jgi:hypothetical protein